MKKILLITGVLLGASASWGQYCLPTYNSACTSGDFINSFTFNTISNLGTGCASPGANNYTDYTAMSTNVSQNTTYPVTCQAGGSWGQYYVAFIDFNNDLDFDDPGEFFDIGYAAGGATVGNNILIPNGIPGGPTRLRVVCRYSSTPLTAADACAIGLSYGECEDYEVVISTPLADDAGIAEFVTPSLPTCSFTDSVRVGLTNYGTNTLFSATIDWTLNASPQTAVLWTGALAPFTTDTVTLGLVALTSGDALGAITSMPNGVVENPVGAWNDLAAIASLQAGLSGTYTIGGTTPDYIDFLSAVSDVNTFGLCGAVVFDVRDGIYNEQIDLTGVISDATNTLTFRSENGDASLVSLSYASTGTANNFIVKLSGSDYVSFEDLTMKNTGTTYGRVLDIGAGSDNNRFENCHLHTITSTSTSTNSAVIYSQNGNDNDNVFMNNIMEGGSYGAYWQGTGTTSLESGTIFEGNTFLDNYRYGLRLYYQDAPVAVGNKVIGNSTYTGTRYGFYAGYCDNGFVFTDNEIAGTATTGWRYGMYIFNCDASVANRSILANNMSQAGQSGITSTFYGIYFSNNGYVDIEHNSAAVTDGGASSRAFYGTGGGGSTLMNNMFANYTAGYAIYLASPYTMSASDNNLLHSPLGNVGYFGATNQATLLDWQTASLFDANSIDMDPMFHSPYNLHVCNDSVKGLGAPIASITMDIDGHTRDAANPDMGADEFSDLTTNFLGADEVFCLGDSVLLWAGAPTDAILWSTGDTTSMIWVSTAGTYDVSINSVCGIANDTIVVSLSADVYSNYIVADTMEFCTGESVQLSSSMPADTYLWTGGSTSDSLTVTTGGTYTLDITDACGSGSESIVINEYSTPTASFTSILSYVTAQFTNTTPASGTMTYSWDFGDSNSSTDSDPIHVYSAVGTYWVELTVTNECGTHVFGDSLTTSSVGIEEITEFGTVAVYPNPSNGIYQLDFNLTTAMDLDVIVVNVLGEVVLTERIEMTNGVHSDVIDITTSAPGVYFVKILSNNEEVMTNILIKE